MERHRKQDSKGYLPIASVLCVLFVIAGLLFIFHMMQKGNCQNLDYMKNDAKQKQTALTKQVVGDLQLLDALATVIGEEKDFSLEEIMPILDRINRRNEFICMGIADLNGSLELVDMNGNVFSHRFNVKERTFFQEALKGRSTVSETLSDALHPSDYINYYGVPVTNTKKEIVAVLCAANSADMFSDIIDTAIFNGQGASNLIDQKGQFIVRSAKLFGTKSGPAEIWDMNIPQSGQLKNALKNGEEYIFEFKQNGKAQVGLVRPAGMNDWSIFSMIPKKVFVEQYSMTALAALLIIVLALVIFILAFYQQRKLSADHEKALETLAYKDSLTGARNRTKFLQDATGYLQEKRDGPCAVWYCDLKKFKYFNDVFGHQKGDEVLQKLADLFHGDEQNPQPPLFCRISADNFTGIRAYEKREELAQWFQWILQQLMDSGDKIESGTGIALCMGFCCIEDGDDLLSVNELIDRANMAQKSVKSHPGSNYAYFSKKIRDEILFEEEMADSGKRALEEGQFVAYAQPKINIQNGDRVVGAEILTRWVHPDRGLIPPGVFIPIFEKNGMIVQLDRYIFEQACIWLRGYLDSHRPLINLAVNVSRLGLLQEDFVEYYNSIKEKYRIPDDVLELEFTESMIWQDDSLFLEIVTQMKECGFICSLDDFGSGHSSLNILKNLPVNVLKLDILFFHKTVDLEREHIVITNIINMAKELQMKTIAEGVEYPETVNFLKDAGCDVIQGYFFSKPMPLTEFDQKLRELDELLSWRA